MKSSGSVVYCDNHILVAKKPSGIATQPDFVEEMKAWVKKEYQKPGAVFLEPIHRLDKPVSGLVLFARTTKALSRLQQAMRERKIKKTYHAKVDKIPEKPEGTLRHFLIHDDFRARIDAGGKEAVLHYKVIGENLLEIVLETGRYHQIRAQLSAIDSPVLGDAKYGSKRPYALGIALSHVKLELEHPVTHQLLIFTQDRTHREASSGEVCPPI